MGLYVTVSEDKQTQLAWEERAQQLVGQQERNRKLAMHPGYPRSSEQAGELVFGVEQVAKLVRMEEEEKARLESALVAARERAGIIDRGSDPSVNLASPKPDRTSAQPAITGAELDEYVALARKAGTLANIKPAIKQQKLVRLLRDSDTLVYDARQVHEYMKAAAQQEPTRTNYVWRPLRASDMPRSRRCRFQHVDQIGGWIIGTTVYRELVPASVLHTVVKLAKLDRNLCFFVTDYEAVRPDPFLAVTKPGLPFYVIEFWNEPGFKPA